LRGDRGRFSGDCGSGSNLSSCSNDQPHARVNTSSRRGHLRVVQCQCRLLPDRGKHSRCARYLLCLRRRGGARRRRDFCNSGPRLRPNEPYRVYPRQRRIHLRCVVDAETWDCCAAITLQLHLHAAKTVPAPAATTTTVGSSNIPFSGDAQSVTLTATVAAASTVNQGTVTFQVMDGATNIGTAVTSAALIGGNAGVIYLLPARTVPNSYTVQAAYSGGPAFQASSGSGTLTVNPSPPQRSRSPRTLPWRGSGTIAPARAPDGWIACGQACTMVLREAE